MGLRGGGVGCQLGLAMKPSGNARIYEPCMMYAGTRVYMGRSGTEEIVVECPQISSPQANGRFAYKKQQT